MKRGRRRAIAGSSAILKQAPTPTPEDANRVEVVSKQPLADAERILRNFVRRAFRRAVTDEDIKPFLARVKAKLDAKSSFEQAMRVGLKAVLVSPHFLFLRGEARQARRLRARQPAVVLPVEFDARRGTARTRREGQAEPAGHAPRGRSSACSKDAKAAAFTENFAGQWLGLREIDATAPDPALYPEYDDVLKVAMVKEALLFFDEVLKNDLSLTNFVSSDFTMLNGRLARHYGIPGVTGQEFKKVTLPPGSHRGGVLTMAGVLKVTANGTTTSPILRGAWVLDRILGHAAAQAARWTWRPSSRTSAAPRPSANNWPSTGSEPSAPVATPRSTRRGSHWRASTSSAAGAIITAASARASRRS